MLGLSLFGKISNSELKNSLLKISSISDDKIVAICNDFGPGNVDERMKLAVTLIQRKHYLQNFMRRL